MFRLLFAVLLLGAGCGPSAATVRLRSKAAKDLRCSDANLETSTMPNSMYWERVNGCGKTNWYVYDGRDWSSPADRAAYDMSCSVEKMSVDAIDKTTYGVTGCDKKAVYILLFSPAGPQWVRNSSGQ